MWRKSQNKIRTYWTETLFIVRPPRYNKDITKGQKMENEIYIVCNEDGHLVNIMPTREAAEKFIVNHGFDSWTIETDVMC